MNKGISFPEKSILNYKLIYYQVYWLAKKKLKLSLGEKIDLNCYFLFADLYHN